MKKNILLASISVGNDPYSLKGQRGAVSLEEIEQLKKEQKEHLILKGPALSLLEQWNIEKFTDVYILTNEEDKSIKNAEELKKEVGILYPEINFFIESLPISDPTSYSQVYKHFFQFVKNLQETYPPENDVCYNIFISPGTPTMHSVWFFLVKSEFLLAQIIESKRGENGNFYYQHLELDINIQDFPIVQKIKREEYFKYVKEEVKKNILMHLFRWMCSAQYHEKKVYGVNNITHGKPLSEVSETLRVIKDDLEKIKEAFSDGGYAKMQQYIDNAKRNLAINFETYQKWEFEEKQKIKNIFSFFPRRFFEELESENFHNLDIEIHGHDLLSERFRIYCEKEVVEAGIRSIINNAGLHAYDGKRGKLEITIEKIASIVNGVECEFKITIQDFGQGTTSLEKMINESSGNDITSIVALSKYFDIKIENHCQVNSYYHLRAEEKINAKAEYSMGNGCGICYIMTAFLPKKI